MGKTEEQFGEFVLTRGVVLEKGRRLAWLTNKAHREPTIQQSIPKSILDLLRTLFESLGGDDNSLMDKRSGCDPRPDYLFHEQLVEVDELQHFTTDRLRTLLMYPRDTVIGFDLGEYRELIATHCRRADAYRAAKRTRDFAFPGGRRAQRAFFDAFRDLVAPHITEKPVIRVPAPTLDARAAAGRFMGLIQHRCS